MEGDGGGGGGGAVLGIDLIYDPSGLKVEAFSDSLVYLVPAYRPQQGEKSVIQVSTNLILAGPGVNIR